MAADLLGLFEAKGLKPVKKTGGEWAAPCPACGGTDRCMIKPADHDGRGGYWCRQCGAYGDAIQFLRDYEGMTYGEACRHLGIEAARATSSLPRPPRPAAAHDPFQAAPSVPPAEQWAEKAATFVGWAHQHLLANPQQLAWLAARGLPLEAVKAYRLGWNPGEKGKSCLIRPRSSWGLPPVETEPDAAGNPGKPKTTFWIPRGLVIPYFDPAVADGQVLRLRIRRPDADRESFGKDKKYYVIPGSNMDAMILGREAKAFVVVESELDALMLHHVAGDLVGTVSVMTANVRKIEAGVHAALADALVILVALDAEGKDGAGAKGCGRWAASFPRAKRWPCPVAKDPGEAFEQGANLRAWIVAGLPPVLRPGLLPPGLPTEAEGGERKGARGEAAEESAAAPADAPVSAGDAQAAAADALAATDHAPEVGADAPAAEPHAFGPAEHAPAAPANAPAVRWLDPDHVTAFGLVPLRELLEAMARHGVEPVLVAGRDNAAERLLALRAHREVPAEERELIGRMFFDACLDAVLWFADYRGMRLAQDLRGVFGVPGGHGQDAAIVRRADVETANLAFVGWVRLDFWLAA